jgi:hypothetical protein
MFAFSVGQLATLRSSGVHKEYGFRYLPQQPTPSGVRRLCAYGGSCGAGGDWVLVLLAIK